MVNNILLLILLAAGCTSSQHRWYRGVVTVGGVAAQVEDVRQTIWAVERGFPETNFMLGRSPSRHELMLGGALGATAMVAWWRFVETLPGDRGPESEYLKDALATLPMLLESICVWRNTTVADGLR